jgi:hypothetical protein
MDIGGHANRFRFLIGDRDSKFTTAFDAVFAGADIRILRTPIRAHRGRNAIAERFTGTLRRECLDLLLITGERHLPAVLSGSTPSTTTRTTRTAHLVRTRPPPTLPRLPAAILRPLRQDWLGGLVPEYVQVV